MSFTKTEKKKMKCSEVGITEKILEMCHLPLWWKELKWILQGNISNFKAFPLQW